MRIRKIIKKLLLALGILAIVFLGYLFIGEAPQAEDITWGISFSQKQAELLGLSWQDNYLALLDDLQIPAIKIIAYWDLIEPETGKYIFNDLDFQIEEAGLREAKVILAIGRKVPRWPECHIPEWARDLNQKEQEERILRLIEKIVFRYRDSDVVWAWQVENEPFFRFGICPDISEDFLKDEIRLVRFLDSRDRPIIISDSGSNRFWFKTARLGDKVSISLYRKPYEWGISYPVQNMAIIRISMHNKFLWF